MKYSSTILLSFLALILVVVLLSNESGAQGIEYEHSTARALSAKLGLGTRPAATLLLNGGFPKLWSEEAGGNNSPRYLQWPIPGKRLGRGFGSDDGRHLAVDITANTGTPIHVMAPGIIGYADNGVKGYGNLIMVIHGGNWVTLYAHLDKFRSEPGQRVKRGDVIGLVGNTGISRGSHLHFALIDRGKPKDPMKFMRGAPSNIKRISD